ncbi:putative serine/threonine-protein kinase [Psilocybe cubensis]|uniref:Serine/threonine-protein kinase n=1 Tax=Psilocybe cubensis TaxID=181762 RepID=A0ACB8GI58_PSICU|nr:putative serine/threonine-protein kinase [Psilocybe cubensis]KAH9474754.1 putative serine/threonine-protein kinase [Psilocybe cubensis]
MPQQIDQSHRTPCTVPQSRPLAREARASMRYTALETLAQLLSPLSSATPFSIASSIASPIASSASPNPYPPFTINSPISPNFGLDLNQTIALSSQSDFSITSGSESGPSSSSPAYSSSSASSSYSDATSIWGVCSSQRAQDIQLRGRTLYTDEPEATPTPKQLTFPSGAGDISSKTDATAEEAGAVTPKAAAKAPESSDSAGPSHRAPKRPSRQVSQAKGLAAAAAALTTATRHTASSAAAAETTSAQAPAYANSSSSSSSSNARLHSATNEALSGILFYGSNSLLPTSPSASASGSGTGSVSCPDQTINADGAKRSSSVHCLWSKSCSSFEERAARLPSAHAKRQPSSEAGRRYEEKRDELLNLLDAHLAGYESILPPHLVSSAAETPLPLHGFSKLQGQSIAVRKVRTIGSGNGTARIESVRAACLLDSHSASGMGLQRDSIWVLKRFQTRNVPFADGVRARAQLKSECEIYRRIAEAPREGKIGLEFIMELVATVSFRGEHCLLLPLMATDLADVLDSRRTVMPRRDTCRIIAQIATGLATLHSIGIIHSDLKPANILFTPSGTVKLADFGLSYRTPTLAPLHRDTVYTARAVGTRGYMAPEKIRAVGYSYPVDYWALGCVFAEMVGVEDRMLRSFEECRDLLTWDEDYGEVEERRSFFKDQELDEDALSLVCGLLDPNPQTRFGILELVAHPYFKNNDLSEFEKIGEMEPENLLVVDSPSPKDIHSMPIYPIETSDPSNDTMYRWINPYGPYVSNC